MSLKFDFFESSLFVMDNSIILVGGCQGEKCVVVLCGLFEEVNKLVFWHIVVQKQSHYQIKNDYKGCNKYCVHK